MLSPFLYSLFIHDCMAKHDANTFIKFADNTIVVGLLTENDETSYTEEVRDLAVWCQDNILSHNLMQDKGDDCELQEKRTKHSPILIDGAVV